MERGADDDIVPSTRGHLKDTRVNHTSNTGIISREKEVKEGEVGC